ncbi:MAG: beta-galactosidase [Rikenellaceae bacterium]
MRIRGIAIIATAIFLGATSIYAASPSKEAKSKIKELKELVKLADSKEIDTQREKCALWMADEFLMYAAWDEKNVDQNEYQYTTWEPYKADAKRLAKELPNFEREEVIKMLDTAIEELEGVIEGKYSRRNIPVIDWSDIKPQGNQFYSNNNPTFFNSYFTIPEHQCNEYVGIPRGASLSLNAIIDENCEVSWNGKQNITEVDSRYSGYVLLWHGAAPKWIQSKDPNVGVGKRLFTQYDIDNPEIRKAWELTFKTMVPRIKETRLADMGYVLADEPHWHSIEKTWATGSVSEYTMTKFRVWLAAQHKDITELNKLWGSNFVSFDDIKINVPISKDVVLTPKGYDWQKFNQDRVTEWFTFLDSSVKKYDTDAKTHIKLIPRLFTHEYHDHGLDMEALFSLTDIVGNDAKLVKKSYFKKYPEYWESRYAFDWKDMAMSYDFFHSVNPDGANVNSESHFLSSTAYRDIYMTKEFTRTTYWIATMHGMNASFSWFWAREADGEIRKDLQQRKDQVDNAMNNAYVASVVQQPRVANEVTKTYMELNAFGSEIAQMQSLRRPIRIFYSETSALCKKAQLDNIYKLYEALYFEGTPLGFVTENIIKKQDNSKWDIVLIKDTEYVTDAEFEALQSCLDRGGKVVMDDISLKFDEYKRPRTKSLQQSNGKIVMVKTPQGYFDNAFGRVKTESLPEIKVEETNEIGKDGCLWRAIKLEDGSYMLSISNIGKSDATINISLNNGEIKSMTDQFLGKSIKNGFTLPSEVTMLIKIK